jgi:hypothetical protein
MPRGAKAKDFSANQQRLPLPKVGRLAKAGVEVCVKRCALRTLIGVAVPYRVEAKIAPSRPASSLEKLSRVCSCSGRRSNVVPALKTSRFGLASDQILRLACSSVASATMVCTEVFRAKSSRAHSSACDNGISIACGSVPTSGGSVAGAMLFVMETASISREKKRGPSTIS